jgi:hypothetical protein
MVKKLKKSRYKSEKLDDTTLSSPEKNPPPPRSLKNPPHNLRYLIKMFNNS